MGEHKNIWAAALPMWIAGLEGFTTLAFQMVALRKAVPIVGSSIVLTSIVIGIILLALSAGYYMGGRLTLKLSESALLTRLQRYLIVSAFYYLLIVYPSFTWVLTQGLQSIGFVPTLFMFSLVFFAIPTFLASHTMPIITHISQGTKGYAAGKILFVSTIGSFLGSTMTALVLFPHIGVFWSGIIASGILLVCAILLGLVRRSGEKEDSDSGHNDESSSDRGYVSKKEPLATGRNGGQIAQIVQSVRSRDAAIVGLCVLIGSAIVTNPHAQAYTYESPYQTIEILNKSFRGHTVRVMQLNGGWASGIDIETGKSFFPYIKEIARLVSEQKPARIAVIGAAGCTLPQEIAQMTGVESVDIVDIDSRVFEIAEREFLREPLHSKITPIAQSARGWAYDAIQRGERYDMIVVDVYNGISLPDELVTVEFFADLKKLTDRVVMNVIADRALESDFSQRFLSSVQRAGLDTWLYDATLGVPEGYAPRLGNMILATYPVEEYVRHEIDNMKPFFDETNDADHERVKVMYAD